MTSQDRSTRFENPVPVPRQHRPLTVVGVAVAFMVAIAIFSMATSRSIAALNPRETPQAGQDQVTENAQTGIDNHTQSASGRQEIRQRDRQLLQAVRQKNAPRVAPRGAMEARETWERQVDEIRQQLRGVEEFPPGSIVWHRREALRHLMEDEPPRD